MRNLTRKFHRTKSPALLLKLDISKAFDSVRWDYLLSLMQRRGFPMRWRNWISSLLSTSTSRIMLNGTPLDPIQHGGGLRQGDPLSPLLFILAKDPLHRHLQVATERGLLSKLNGRVARFRASMYADDAVIFLKPTPTDAANIKELLLNFGVVTGLHTNLQKTSVTPIGCSNINIEPILAILPVAHASFPLKYLGLLAQAGLPTFNRQSFGEAFHLEWKKLNSGWLGLPHQISAIFPTCLLNDCTKTA